MHYALPNQSVRNIPSKSKSFPIAKGHGSYSHLTSMLRRPLAYAIGVVLFIYLLLNLRSHETGTQRGDPEVVIVTLLDRANFTSSYLEKVVENRREYARMHGYKVFIRDVEDYKTGSTYHNWARVPVMRHALSTYPTAGHYWFLSAHHLITNPTLTLHEHILNPPHLDAMMLREHPVTRTSNIIKTFRGVRARNVHLVLSMDEKGMSMGSWILRGGEWAKFLLDVWFDPVYRFYYNWRSDKVAHALEHILQWHPTVLSNIALIPQRTFNSEHSLTTSLGAWQDGDFVVSLEGCEEKGSGRNCERELDSYLRNMRR